LLSILVQGLPAYLDSHSSLYNLHDCMCSLFFDRHFGGRGLKYRQHYLAATHFDFCYHLSLIISLALSKQR
jgi:hypothetical protein